MELASSEQRSIRGNRPPSERVIEAVAAAEGCDPTELAVPLFDAVDPDALDAMFPDESDSNGVRSVSFPYLGYRVVVRDDGTVSVDRE